MAARLSRLLVALGFLLGAALPSAAAAVVRPPTSQELAASPVPAHGADPVYARSYFGARYYRANLGRFTTIDPKMAIKDNLADPQRWNRYAYARNNPLRWIDPDGRDVVFASPEHQRQWQHIARESPTFAIAWLTLDENHDVIVRVGDKTIQDRVGGKPPHYNVYRAGGKQWGTIFGDSDQSWTSEDFMAHEVGHAVDAYEDYDRFAADSRAEKNDRSGSKSHYEWPHEFRAEEFRKKVEKERKEEQE